MHSHAAERSPEGAMQSCAQRRTRLSASEALSHPSLLFPEPPPSPSFPLSHLSLLRFLSQLLPTHRPCPVPLESRQPLQDERSIVKTKRKRRSKGCSEGDCGQACRDHQAFHQRRVFYKDPTAVRTTNNDLFLVHVLRVTVHLRSWPWTRRRSRLLRLQLVVVVFEDLTENTGAVAVNVLGVVKFVPRTGFESSVTDAKLTFGSVAKSAYTGDISTMLSSSVDTGTTTIAPRLLAQLVPSPYASRIPRTKTYFTDSGQPKPLSVQDLLRADPIDQAWNDSRRLYLMPTCTFCTKFFAEGKPWDTHDATCKKKKDALRRIREEAIAREEREAAEQAEAERLAAEAVAEDARRDAEAEARFEMLHAPSPPPVLRQSDGRPQRQNRRRPKHYEDNLPEPPPPAPVPLPPNPIPDPAPRPRLWVKTKPNGFGVYKVYLRQPTHDPDRLLTLADLCQSPEFVETAPKPDERPWFHPLKNASQALLMNWHYLESSKDSIAGSNRLIQTLFTGPEKVDPAEIEGFSIERGNTTLDKWADTMPGKSLSWKTASVTLKVPSTTVRPNKPPLEFTVDNIHYRPSMDIIRDAFTSHFFRKLHTTPFSLRWDPKHNAARTYPAVDDPVEMDEYGLPPLPNGHQELFGEMYSARRTFREYSKLPASEEEPVIVSLMPWSDATHLANFGTASLWPRYLFLGNQSKYQRAKPSEAAIFHQAYFPSIPDRIKEVYKEYYGHNLPDNVMTFIKRELYQAVLELLIDPEFVDAWAHGAVVECEDHVRRRLFPRIPTHGLDYPEKVMAAMIKYLASYPCPRCLILKTDIPMTGSKLDMRRRAKLRDETSRWRNSVANARKAIFERGAAVDGDVVKRKLGEGSYAPIQNAFHKLSEGLAEVGLSFNVFETFVPDLLHEIELGVVKMLLTHLIRILYALNKEKVTEFDARFRQITSFRRGTIRKFHKNVSEMKKLAARDFEDILQCLLPVCEGLFDEHDALVQQLILQLSFWHAFAKLRLHTTATLERFMAATEELCATIRAFARDTHGIKTRETKQDQQKRKRAAASKTGTSSASRPPVADDDDDVPREKPLNLVTYKYHSMPDYPLVIPEVGTMDGTSTQTGELAHRLVKRLYAKTNRRNFESQIARQEQRIRIMKAMFAKKKLVAARARRSVNGNDNVPPPAKKARLSRTARFRRALTMSEGLLPYTPASSHHFVSNSQRNPYSLDDIPGMPHEDDEDDDAGDPAFGPNWILELREHIAVRYEGRESDDDASYTPENLLRVQFRRNEIYAHATMNLNYNTYDLQRDQDNISVRTRPYVMVFSRDLSDPHPYAYGQVVGIFHAWVRMGDHPFRRMEFLYVRWLARSRSSPCIPERARLPRLEFLPYQDEDAFGFLNPDALLRGVHLIPAFKHGRTKDLMPKSIARRESEGDEDWRYYYANAYVFSLFSSSTQPTDSVVDRDMFTRYQRDAVGHRNIWKDATYSLAEDIDEMVIGDDEDDSEAASAARAAELNDDEGDPEDDQDGFWDDDEENPETEGGDDDVVLEGVEADLDSVGLAPQ
uniref:C2H2-type domain-containing protein n=1 Tax=Mycena chlorophos TaxID=658473 RepID=A0ABQ0M103_MYCCL|nr:predicted protein [Mycena chlorophos]